jgi:hypothetical protein
LLRLIHNAKRCTRKKRPLVAERNGEPVETLHLGLEGEIHEQVDTAIALAFKQDLEPLLANVLA